MEVHVNYYDKSDALVEINSAPNPDRSQWALGVQRDISKLVNSGDRFNSVATVVDALVHDHRTIQQSTVRFLVEVLVTYGSHCAADDGMLTDGRNEAAVKLCQQIADLVDGTGSIPHI